MPLLLAMQSGPSERRVMRHHDNGKEHVVLFLNKVTGEPQKEEVFYPNGKMQWSGNYSNGIENGAWQFYWEIGRIKTVENYVNGKEHGVTTHYDEQGKKTKEEFWKHGKLIKEMPF